MKIYLDLLPEEKKEEIKRKKIFLKVVHSELIFAIPMIAFFVILATINFSLKEKTKEIERIYGMDNSQKEYKELENYENSFGEINTKVNSVFKLQKGHNDWSNIFYKLNNTVPENVYLSDLVTVDYKISIAGKAKTREDFLKFQEKIKSEGCFLDVEVPLSNLVSKENVAFQLNFNVKKDCLKSLSNK